MRALFTSVFGLLVSLGVMAAEQELMPEERIWQTGFPWLAEEGASSQPFEVPVYQLSCASCLETFAALLNGEEEPSALFLLNTAQLHDREIARVLIATTLAQPGMKAQRQVFRHLLKEFVSDPEGYLNDPAAWRQFCMTNWGGGVSSDDPLLWAEALNRLHEHNRILGLLDVYQTPTWLSMDEESRVVKSDDELDEYARQFRMLMVTEPSLQPVLSDGPVLVHEIRFDPGARYNSEDWATLVAQMEVGALWLWEESPATASKEIQQWRERMESLPDLESRRDFFLTTFLATSTWKTKGNWSFRSYLRSKR